jgi:hypothetical protein
MKILTNRQMSQKSEAAAAVAFKGRTQIASGSLHFAKGDVICDRFLIEDKITDKLSYALKKSILDKIRIEAANRGRRAMLRVTLLDGKPYCIVSQDEMLEILMLANLL